MSISDALEDLISALREHAEVMSGADVGPEQAVAVIDRVRSAALRYSDETFESAGWGSPFADLFEDDDEEDGEAAAVRIPEEAERFSISGRWDFYVSDKNAWLGHASRRLEELGAADCVPELNSSAQAAHELLVHSHFLEEFTAHGLVDGGTDWQIEEVSNVLSELSREERWE